MSEKLNSAIKKTLGQKPLQSPYVTTEIYISHMKDVAHRMQRLEKKTSKDSIRKIAEAAYQKQEQRLNNLRDECVRVLSLLRDKGVVTQEEINQAVRGG